MIETIFLHSNVCTFVLQLHVHGLNCILVAERISVGLLIVRRGAETGCGCMSVRDDLRFTRSYVPFWHVLLTVPRARQRTGGYNGGHNF